ncbi:MAG: hypothetical protein ABIR65_01185 [Pseudolysinimonas sp.]
MSDDHILYIRYREYSDEAKRRRMVSHTGRHRDAVHPKTLFVGEPKAKSSDDRYFTEVILDVDLNELRPRDRDEYEHAEARMVHWTTRCQQLRPDRALPSVEWRELSTTDAEELSRVFSAWSDMRQRALGEERVAAVRALIEEQLAVVLDQRPAGELAAPGLAAVGRHAAELLG